MGTVVALTGLSDATLSASATKNVFNEPLHPRPDRIVATGACAAVGSVVFY